MKHPINLLGSEPAYNNHAFLDSDDGRSIRILSEYLEPLFRLRHEGIHETVVFFGSTPDRRRPFRKILPRCTIACQTPVRMVKYRISRLQAIYDLFRWCWGFMEAANRGAADAGSSTIGFNIGLPHEQRPNPYVTPSLLFEFHYFFMRKCMVHPSCSSLIVFPGGFGTIDEFMEIVTLAQTSKNPKRNHHYFIRL